MLPVVGLALLSDDDSGLHRPRIRPRSFSQCGKGPARASDHTLAETRVHYKRAQPASPKATVCPCRTEGGTRLAIQLSDRGGASPPGPAAHADDRDGGTDPWAVTWGLLCPGLDVHVISAGRRAGRPHAAVSVRCGPNTLCCTIARVPIDLGSTNRNVECMTDGMGPCTVSRFRLARSRRLRIQGLLNTFSHA